MAKKTAKAGDFVEITARKVSSKVQPEIKVGGLYHVNRVERLKSGAAVLVIDKDPKRGKTVRCNAERFSWEVRTPAELQERQFKEQCNADTERIMHNFTFDEHVQIAFVPLIIGEVAWHYAEKVLRYCAEKRISEVKKLSRTVRDLRERYLYELGKDLDTKHRLHTFQQAEDFINECRMDFQILYFSTNNELNHQCAQLPHDEMRTYAYLAMLFCKEVREHEARMTELIRRKLGSAREGHIPCFEQLHTCMEAYLGNMTVQKTATIQTAMKIFQKNLSKIEFTLV